MLGTAKKHANRVGCLPVKFMFTVHIKSVLLPKDSPLISSGAILSVCFERGGKISSTNNKSCDIARQDSKTGQGAVDINEKVELIATLYKDSKTGIYQEKTSKLILRQLKKNSIFNLDAYKGLGLYTLQLNQFASEIGFSTIYVSPSLKLPLDLLTNTFLEVSITTHILKSHSAYNEDTRSMMSSLSGASDVSCIGATFERATFSDDNDSGGDNNKKKSKRTSGSGSGSVGSSGSRAKGRMSIESIKEEQEEDEEEGDDGVDPVSNGRSSGSNNKTTSAQHKTANGNGQLVPMNHRVSFSPSSPGEETVGSPSIAPEEVDLSGEVQVSKKLLSWNVVKGDSKKDRLKKRKANKEAFRIYNQEIENKNAHILSLENELQQQAERHKEQLLLIQKKLSVAEKTNAVHEDRERHARTVLTNAYDKADLKFAEQLALQREENVNLIEEYGRVISELSVMTEEVAYYKALAETALKEKRDEQLATQNAATVAVKASMRRAELEMENEEMVEEMIDMKVKYANVCFDLDHAMKKNQMTKKRLQFYAEQFAALEVKYSNSVDGGAGGGGGSR